MKIEQTFRRYLFIFIFIHIAVLPMTTQAQQNTENTPSRRGEGSSPEPTQSHFLNIGTFGVFTPRFRLRPDLLDRPSYYGIEFGYIYETHKYAITTELHLVNSPSAFISIGGRYFFDQRNISTYVGCGCAIGVFFWMYQDPVEDYGFAFIVPIVDIYASTGIEMFRWTNSRLKLEARTNILMPVYTIGLSFAYDIGN